MRRLVLVVPLLACVFIATGCATTRGVIDVPAKMGTNPPSGPAVRIDRVTDRRVFEIDPRQANIPSLMNDAEIKTPRSPRARSRESAAASAKRWATSCCPRAARSRRWSKRRCGGRCRKPAIASSASKTRRRRPRSRSKPTSTSSGRGSGRDLRRSPSNSKAAFVSHHRHFLRYKPAL
jgi:hypothetical protein